MLYWVPETATSSARLYYETMHAGKFPPQRLPRRRADRLRDLPEGDPEAAARVGGAALQRARTGRASPSGGHFAAMEEPAALVEDIRAFFRPLR